MQDDLKAELQRLVFDAVDFQPGMKIKEQINSACDNLGYPKGYWRVRDAFYGFAKNWRANAVFDLMRRHDRFIRQRREPASEKSSSAGAAG